MKAYSLMPLQSHKMKLVGIIISTLAITAMVIENLTGKLLLIDGFDVNRHFYFLFLLNSIGLYTIAFSKEKIEDERVQVLRDKTFRASFGLTMSTMLALSITYLFMSVQSEVKLWEIFPFMATLMLSFHLIIFNIRLYTNNIIEEGEVSLFQNIKNHKAFFIVFVVLNIILLAILLL